MNQIITILIWLLAISYSTTYSQEKLEIEGAIILKDAEDSTPEPGTIRWTGTDFQGWNGTKWVSLTTKVAYDGEVMDVDGNVYPTIKIGTQEWMAENLKTSRYRDSTAVQHKTDDTEWGNANFGAWCWYDNNNSLEHPYGKLYNWYAVNDNRGLCPTGWHAPENVDWITLMDNLGGELTAGSHMIEAGTAHWNSPNLTGTNSSGFTGLGGGYRIKSGAFLDFGNVGYWWSSTESSNTNNAWLNWVNRCCKDLARDDSNADKSLGASIRCLKD